MAAPFVVACSHCDSQLKLKDASFVGKKVRCPKCQEAFVVAAPKGTKRAAAGAKPKQPKDEFGFLNNISEDDYEAPPGEEGEEDFDDLPAPPSRKKSGSGKSKSKKKRRASSGPNLGKIGLIAGLIVLGLAVVGGGVYGVYALVSSLGGGAGRLAWLPDDTEAVIEIRPADLWNSPVLQPLTGGQAGTSIADRFKSVAKLNLTDLQRVVVGGAHNAKNPIVVIYSSVPFPVAELQANTIEIQHGGYALYMDDKGAQGAFLPEPTTLVHGTEADLKAAIDRGGVCAAASKFSELPSSGHVNFAVLRPAAAQTRGKLPLPGDFDVNSLQSVTASLNFASDIAVNVSTVCNDATVAEKLAATMEQGRTEALAKLETQRSQLVPNPLIDVTKLQAMLDSQRQILESASVNASGAQVSAKLTVPGKLIADAADTFGAMVPMMLQSLPKSGGGPRVRPTPPSRPSPGDSSPGEHGGGSEHAEHADSTEIPAGETSPPTF